MAKFRFVVAAVVCFCLIATLKCAELSPLGQIPEYAKSTTNASSIIEMRSPMYLTHYERDCPCLGCGGMARRECSHLCDYYGYSYWECNRCSCQCGRGPFVNLDGSSAEPEVWGL